jgi:hypothetical protein
MPDRSASAKASSFVKTSMDRAAGRRFRVAKAGGKAGRLEKLRSEIEL